MSAKRSIICHKKRLRSSSHVKGSLALALLAGSCVLPLARAQAADGATFDLGDGITFNIGTGIRTSVSAVSAFAPSAGDALGGDGDSTIARYNLDDFRIYSSLSLNQNIKFTVDTERANPGSSGPGIQLLDAIAQFEPIDEVNVWVGQMLPPSDRSNLDGPFYLSEWYYPGIVSQYPSRFFGRDIGGTVWGKVFDKKIVYSVGIYAGHNWQEFASSENQNPLFAARVAYNFWDPEPAPAYYTGSTYYGKYDILTVAFAGQFQHDGVGPATWVSPTFHPADYAAWNIDALMEKKIGDYGVITLEGAFYDYNTGGTTDFNYGVVPVIPPGFNAPGTTAMVGGITQGTAYMLSAAYLIPYDVGPGKFQPYARWQEFTATVTNTSATQFDAGVNYVIKGPDLRVTFDWAHNDASFTPISNRWVVGLQVQL
ncbi:MAG TPA: hypothetical protein VL996_04945 [Methylocella sp.]|nr:hypothetical protein [Methylocella sp.]